MVLSVKRSDIIYSYADYLEWDDSERWEIINGVAYNMHLRQTESIRKYRKLYHVRLVFI